MLDRDFIVPRKAQHIVLCFGMLELERLMFVLPILFVDKRSSGSSHWCATLSWAMVLGYSHKDHVDRCKGNSASIQRAKLADSKRLKIASRVSNAEAIWLAYRGPSWQARKGWNFSSRISDAWHAESIVGSLLFSHWDWCLGRSHIDRRHMDKWANVKWGSMAPWMALLCWTLHWLFYR